MQSSNAIGKRTSYSPISQHKSYLRYNDGFKENISTSIRFSLSNFKEKMDAKTFGSAISPFKSDILSLLKGVKDEYINFFEFGLTNYIENRKDKLSLTNTFLFPDKKVNFYEVYFPLSLTVGKSDGIIDSDKLLSNLFIKTNVAGIFGVAGSGKTMLMKHIFLQCYSNTFKIPIYIELRDFNSNGFSFSEYIYKIVLDNKLKPNTRILDRALQGGRFLFVLDGFDEINFEIKEKLIREIDEFIDINTSNFFLFSSRPGTTLENFPRLKTFNVNALRKIEINSFIEVQLKSLNDTELIIKLKDTIDDISSSYYVEYLSSPLLLSMYILTYKNYPELPRSKNKFYWNVFDTLCTKHDSITKKGGYLHQRKSKIQNEDFEAILKAFCYISLFECKYNFDKEYIVNKLKFVRDRLRISFDIEDLLYDLKVSISILIEEGMLYKFPHRTMQDYFAALFIKDLNDVAKKEVYAEKIKAKLIISSNLSFLELCQELDIEAYYEFFLLPNMEEFCEKFRKSENEDNICNIFKDAMEQYEFEYHEDEETYSLLSVTRSDSFFCEFISLFDMDYLDICFIHLSIWNSHKDSILYKLQDLGYLEYTTEKDVFLLRVNRIPAGYIWEFINFFDIRMNIEEFYKFMVEKEKYLKEEIDTLKKNKLSIWNF